MLVLPSVRRFALPAVIGVFCPNGYPRTRTMTTFFSFHRFTLRAAVACAAVTLAAVFTPACPAEFIVNIEPSGSNVVATGVGTINTIALYNDGGGNVNVGIEGSSQGLVCSVGDWSGVDETLYLGPQGPSLWPWSNGIHWAQNGQGDAVAIEAFNGMIWLSYPNGYSSGNPLSSTATWTGATLSSLGLTPGTASWTWGSGPTADSFVIKVSAPEPTSLALVATALLMFGVASFVRCRHRAA